MDAALLGAGTARRHHFIPVRKSDIAQALGGEPRFAAERDEFLQFCRVLGAVFHYESFDELERLKDAYFHFNPRLADAGGAVPSETAYAELIAALGKVLERANFIEVQPDEIERANRERGVLPVEVSSPVDDYRDIRIYRRGAHRERLEISEWLGLRRWQVDTEVYDDVVLVAAAKSAAALGATRRKGRRSHNGGVLIKYFHDIASADLNTLLPDVRVIMNRRDRWMLGLPALVGGVPLILKLAPTLAVLFLLAGVRLGYTGTVEQDHMKQALAVMSGVIALGSFGAHQWLKYQRKALRYLVAIKDSIYFRNVNNNAGVFDALVGAAEEQEFKEAVLAYSFLHAVSMSEDALDQQVEGWLREKFAIDVDFEAADGVAKLSRLGLLQRAGEQLSVPPLGEALRILDRRWDAFFDFNQSAMDARRASA